MHCKAGLQLSQGVIPLVCVIKFRFIKQRESLSTTLQNIMVDTGGKVR